ncbi:MAG: polyprenyl synthetase family protein [Gaiellaceae bacterium]
MNAPAITQLAPVLEAGGERLAELIARTEARLEEVMAGHGEPLASFAGQTLGAGGKRLRPMLVYICGGETWSEEIVRAGVAVELLHMATLVHDDVLDGAALRRGRPTVFAQCGRGAATATGDFLFSRAFAELCSTGSPEAVRVLSSASSALARGELAQRADAWSTDVTVERYLERCELKTARLFEAACRLGDHRLGAFGNRIGVAFQIFDDVLDVSGPAERTGKARGTDLLDGTVTLPLILARARDPELRTLDVRRDASIDEVCDRIAATGALEDARAKALEYVADAKALLGELDLSERQSRTLELVADGVVERYA